MSEYREITPECRANRGDYPAYDQAAHDLWHVYGVMLSRHPDATFVLTLARKPDAAASAVEDLEQQRKRADQAEELLQVAHETSNRSEAERASAVQRAEKAEALLLRFAAEAHRRKWDYDRGLNDAGVPLKSEAFNALHRLGEEMRTALEELRRMADEAQQDGAGS